jgi:hypothetical protein
MVHLHRPNQVSNSEFEIKVPRQAKEVEVIGEPIAH